MAKPATAKPTTPKPTATKPVATKPATAKPTQKAVQPKKQVANDATMKVTKPVTNATPKQQNEKRKREENGSTPVHDVDKKMKEAPESTNVSTTGKKILYTNVPETAQRSDFEAVFANLAEKPHIKIFAFKNKTRTGQAVVTFSSDEAFNQAAALHNVSVQGHVLHTIVNPQCNESRSVYVANFPNDFEESDIRQFFSGSEISLIQYTSTSSGKVLSKFFIEFADEQSKEAAVQKSKTMHNGSEVVVFPYQSNKTRVVLPKKVKKTPPPPKKAAAKPTPKNPNQAKPPQAKKPNQNKPSPAKKPNQNKPSPAKGKKAAPKPGAKVQKKAQKKN